MWNSTHSVILCIESIAVLFWLLSQPDVGVTPCLSLHTSATRVYCSYCLVFTHFSGLNPNIATSPAQISDRKTSFSNFQIGVKSLSDMTRLKMTASTLCVTYYCLTIIPMWLHLVRACQVHVSSRSYSFCCINFHFLCTLYPCKRIILYSQG